MKTPLLFVLMGLCFWSAAQTPEEAIAHTARTSFQEKVVVGLVKKEYLASEKIFFKAHVLNGYKLSEASTTLYTEMYNGQQQLIDKALVPLFGGSGEGNFTLPASAEEGVYFIRAYTAHMRAFNPAFQYLRPIQVYNPASGTKLLPKKSSWSAVAVPEGGTLLAGQLVKVAVRLTSATALPQSWQADLYDAAAGQVVMPVQVYNNEVGAVTFIPDAGKTYTVRIKDGGGITKEVALPAVKPDGSALSLSVVKGKVAYQVSTKNLPLKGAGYKLMALHYDQPVFAVTIKSSTGEVTGVMNTKELTDGVLRFILFTEKGEVANERLCFIQHTPRELPALVADTVSGKAKAYNAWRLNADSTLASYTVQVTGAAEPVANDFLAQVYLTTDFTTPIHQAGWYLTDGGADSKAALDALLITEQMERFPWEKIAARQFPVDTAGTDNYLRYTAVVRKAGKPQPLRDVNLIIQQVADSSTQMLQTKTDEAGTFTISEAIFTDTVKVFFQAGDRKFLEKDIKIDFEPQNKFYSFTGAFPEAAFETAPRLPTDTLSSAVKEAMARMQFEKGLSQKAQVMQEIIIKTTTRNSRQELEKRYSSPYFSAANSTTFDFVNENQGAAQGYSNILFWLRGRVSGLTVTTTGGRTEVRIRGNTSLLGASTVQIYVDNMAVDADYLTGIPVPTIAMVKVIKGPSLAGGGNGAIAIFTKRGGEAVGGYTGSLPSGTLVGYRKQPRYFWPDYSIPQLREGIDERPVLYYATTFLDADDKGVIPIRFYNNDKAKGFRLQVTGFGPDGQPFYMNNLVQ